MTVLCLLLSWLPLLAQDRRDGGTPEPGDGHSIGFVASERASAKEVGLPVYPGSRPHVEKSDDSPAVQLGLWGRTWGFKLAVLKLESEDSPEKVEAFYEKALSNYGKVLNCAKSAEKSGGHNKPSSENEIGCQDDHPESGETLLKAGTKLKQHIVSIKPEGRVTVLQLVYLETPPSSDSN